MRSGLLGLVLILSLPLAAAAQRTCVEGVVCVYTREGNNEISFFVESTHDETIRVTLLVDHLNMVADQDLPHSRLYEPGTTTRALTLTKFPQHQGVSLKWRFYWQPASGSDLSCAEQIVCVLSERIENRVVFQALNLTDHTLSVQFRPTLENLRTNVPLPATRIVAPQDSVTLIHTWIVDPFQRFRFSFRYPWRYGAVGERHALDAAYLLPHAVPDLPVRKGRSDRPDERNGVYWYAPDGASVRAARQGRVIDIRPSTQEGDTVYTVRIQHEEGSLGLYRYLDSVAVAPDSLITAGSVLGFAPKFVMLTIQILKPDFTYVSVPIRFYLRDGSIRALKNGEVF